MKKGTPFFICLILCSFLLPISAYASSIELVSSNTQFILHGAGEWIDICHSQSDNCDAENDTTYGPTSFNTFATMYSPPETDDTVLYFLANARCFNGDSLAACEGRGATLFATITVCDSQTTGYDGSCPAAPTPQSSDATSTEAQTQRNLTSSISLFLAGFFAMVWLVRNHCYDAVLSWYTVYGDVPLSTLSSISLICLTSLLSC